MSSPIAPSPGGRPVRAGRPGRRPRRIALVCTQSVEVYGRTRQPLAPRWSHADRVAGRHAPRASRTVPRRYAATRRGHPGHRDPAARRHGGGSSSTELRERSRPRLARVVPQECRPEIVPRARRSGAAAPAIAQRSSAERAVRRDHDATSVRSQAVAWAMSSSHEVRLVVVLRDLCQRAARGRCRRRLATDRCAEPVRLDLAAPVVPAAAGLFEPAHGPVDLGDRPAQLLAYAAGASGELNPLDRRGDAHCAPGGPQIPCGPAPAAVGGSRPYARGMREVGRGA